jgi:hypothetical protein
MKTVARAIPPGDMAPDSVVSHFFSVFCLVEIEVAPLVRVRAAHPSIPR